MDAVQSKIFFRYPWFQPPFPSSSSKHDHNSNGNFKEWKISNSSIMIFLHVLILTLSCMIHIFHCYQWGSYIRAASVLSCNNFMPSSPTCVKDDCYEPFTPDGSSLSIYQSCKLNTINSTLSALSETVRNYFDLFQDQSLAQVSLPWASPLLLTNSQSSPCFGHVIPSIALRYSSKKNSIDFPLSIEGNYYNSNHSVLDAKLINESSLSSIELKLPLISSLASDDYNGIYLWQYSILFTKGRNLQFEVTHSETIIDVCNEKRVPSTTPQSSPIFLTSSSSLSYTIYSFQIAVFAISCLVFAITFTDLQNDWSFYLLISRHFSDRNDADNISISSDRDPLISNSFLSNVVHDDNGRDCDEEVKSHNGRDNIFPSAPTNLYGYDLERRKLTDSKWDHVPLTLKIRFLDGWRLMFLTGCLLCLLNAAAFLFIRKGFLALSLTQRMSMGFSVSILWISLLGYFRYTSRLITGVLVLFGSLRHLNVFFVSFIPIFLSVAMMGMSTFGDLSSYFTDFNSTFATIFSLTNSDSIYDVLMSFAVANNRNANFFQVVGFLFILFVMVTFAYLLMRLLLAVIEGVYWQVTTHYSKAIEKRKLFRSLHKTDKKERNKMGLFFRRDYEANEFMRRQQMVSELRELLSNAR